MVSFTGLFYRSLSQVSFTDTCRLRQSSLLYFNTLYVNTLYVNTLCVNTLCVNTLCVNTLYVKTSKRCCRAHKCKKKGLRTRLGLSPIWHTGEQPAWLTCEWVITHMWVSYNFGIEEYVPYTQTERGLQTRFGQISSLSDIPESRLCASYKSGVQLRYRRIHSV